MNFFAELQLVFANWPHQSFGWRIVLDRVLDQVEAS
jgi:hypothetical protein